MPKGFEKKFPNLQVGGPAPAPPTPPVIRVVLLHTEAAVQDLCPGTVRSPLPLMYMRDFPAKFGPVVTNFFNLITILQ